MTADEAIAIIEREIACVNKECNIERACGQCELVMPSKEPIIEAYKLAIEALKTKPCIDAVSRQAILDIWHTSYSNNREENEEIQYKKIAFELSPVTPEKPKGEWLTPYGSYSYRLTTYKCSLCRCETDNRSNYCSSCGADMRGGKE